MFGVARQIWRKGFTGTFSIIKDLHHYTDGPPFQTQPSYGAINLFARTASTKPSFAVVWHHGLRSISTVIAAAKQDDHCLRGNAAMMFSIVDAEKRCGLRPTLSVKEDVSQDLEVMFV